MTTATFQKGFFFLIIGGSFLIVRVSGIQAEYRSSPRILDGSSSTTVFTERGQSVRLKCLFNAGPDAKVNWMKNGLEVRHDCESCIIKVNTQLDTQTSYFEIKPFIKEDFGEYECRVRNAYGSAKLKISLKKTDANETKCQKERISSEDPRKKRKFRPVCDEDGSYHEVQCSIEHDTCWCVNTLGKKTLDVIDGANGLRCFAPKDLSVVAIIVLTQGIFVILLLLDQIVDVYTDYSVCRAIRKCFQSRQTVRKKEYKALNDMEVTEIPLSAENKRKRKKRKVKS